MFFAGMQSVGHQQWGGGGGVSGTRTRLLALVRQLDPSNRRGGLRTCAQYAGVGDQSP